jgi:hypothetical protein
MGLCRVIGMFSCMNGVRPGDVRMMRRFLVVSAFVVLGGLGMMPGSV